MDKQKHSTANFEAEYALRKELSEAYGRVIALQQERNELLGRIEELSRESIPRRLGTHKTRGKVIYLHNLRQLLAIRTGDLS